MSEVKDIRGYSFSSSDRLLIDTNVWMFIHGPSVVSGDGLIAYTHAYRVWRDSKCQIFFNIMILSEFINTYARMEFKQYAPEGDIFKSFRDSPHFGKVAEEIAEKCRRIMKLSQRCDGFFSEIDLAQMMDEFGSGHVDFNDQIIYEMCRSNGFILVTHDQDFADRDLTILTANRNLLSLNSART